MLIFFGSSGDLAYLKDLFAEEGFTAEIAAYADPVREGWAITSRSACLNNTAVRAPEVAPYRRVNSALQTATATRPSLDQLPGAASARPKKTINARFSCTALLSPSLPR